MTVAVGARLAARLPPALPLLDGPRRLAGGAARGADLADRPAGGPDPARDPGQLPRAPLPAAPRRGRHPPRRARVLVPPLAPRDAPADPDRDAFRRLPDPPRASLLLDQVQHRRPDRAAEERQRPPGLRHGQRASSRPTARRRSGSRSRARRRGATVALAARIRRTEGVAEVLPPQPARGRRHRDPGGLGRTRSTPTRARKPSSGSAAFPRRRARPSSSAAPPPTSSTSSRASPATSRSRSGSSSSRPW